MTALAYALIVAIPLSAFVTVALALRRGRPRAYESWETPRIQARLAELERVAAGPEGPAGTGGPQGPDVRRERRGLRDELFRRGLGH